MPLSGSEWSDCAILAAVAALLFVARHRRKPAQRSKSSLAGIARDILRESRTQSMRTPRGMLITGLVLLGCLSVWLPSACLAVARLVPPESARLALGLAGALLVLATLANVLVIVVAHTNFMFGGGATRDATPFAWLIPAYVGACALAALVAAAWRDAALWVLRT